MARRWRYDTIVRHASTLGVYDEAEAQFTIYTSAGGGVIRQRDDIAGALGVAKDRVRVVSAISAGISGSATIAARSSRWSPGRQNASAGRSSGFASGATPS